MSRPAVAAIETNLAYVFLTPDRAYKQLKPVQLPFVDQRSAEARRVAVVREFDINRHISPTVYLGIGELHDETAATEHVLVMRRLDEDRSLAHRLTSGPAIDDVDLTRIARRIASLHLEAPARSGAAAEPGSVAALRTNWIENLDVLRRHTGQVLDADEVEEVGGLAMSYVRGRLPLFEQRQRAGWVREGHGDLRAEHTFLEDDAIELIDALAFDDRFRIGDVLNDIAFLAMDAERLGGADVATTLMSRWAEFTNERHPSSLAHFYVAYRAHVRAKVECLRHEAGQAGAVARIRAYHRLALQHLRMGRPRLILVGGGPGVGKSTIAAGLARELGAVWLRSDEVRKDLAGVAHHDHAFADPGQGIYTAEMTARVHATMAHEAELLLGRGESVVVDATWSTAAPRAEMRALAARAAAELTELRCVLDPAIAKERIARRMASVHEPSDATPELVDYLGARFHAWPEATDLDTAGTVEASAAKAARAVHHDRPARPIERRFFVDAPVTRIGDELYMTHEGPAVVSLEPAVHEGVG